MYKSTLKYSINKDNAVEYLKKFHDDFLARKIML